MSPCLTERTPNQLHCYASRPHKRPVTWVGVDIAQGSKVAFSGRDWLAALSRLACPITKPGCTWDTALIRPDAGVAPP
ncbi:hypothetical protein DHEL01_v205215 [Diaporthe helianthi]|uniref:Uncharacterized protein n=1 Tax=Diaporthe helianthi TaxID=158607 RepID=A0A2P5I1M9_DIAHE|nr:hypothetical protein DHEL01_v205215 [Diaporthe helianthi]